MILSPLLKIFIILNNFSKTNQPTVTTISSLKDVPETFMDLSIP